MRGGSVLAVPLEIQMPHWSRSVRQSSEPSTGVCCPWVSNAPWEGAAVHSGGLCVWGVGRDEYVEVTPVFFKGT